MQMTASRALGASWTEPDICAYCGQPITGGPSCAVSVEIDEDNNAINRGTSFHTGCYAHKQFEDETRERLARIEAALGITS